MSRRCFESVLHLRVTGRTAIFCSNGSFGPVMDVNDATLNIPIDTRVEILLLHPSLGHLHCCLAAAERVKLTPRFFANDFNCSI